jgi:uncharacterized membrane protein HdeD (DUF308 family)
MKMEWTMNASSQARAPLADAAPAHEGRGLLVAYGALLILGGIFALIYPIATGLATGVLLGAILLVYGVLSIAAGLSRMLRRLGWVEVLVGGLAIIVGLITLFNPLSGAVSLTWVIGAWLAASGVFHLVAALRGGPGRGWRFLLGIVDSILGLILLFSSPLVAIVYIAALVGLSLLFRGTTMLALAVMAGRPRHA